MLGSIRSGSQSMFQIVPKVLEGDEGSIQASEGHPQQTGKIFSLWICWHCYVETVATKHYRFSSKCEKTCLNAFNFFNTFILDSLK